MITDHIKELVKGECDKKQNELGSAFFEQHIMLVKEYACRLADILGADREIVELSSYLHDISAVIDISTLSRHSDLSAEAAEIMLKDMLYEPDRIEAIKKVIKSHSAPMKIGEGTLEEICVSNADAISQIVNPSYWLYFAFSIRKMGYEQGLAWYKQKVSMNMEGLIQQAKDMTADIM
jgi:uncharacterized protein